MNPVVHFELPANDNMRAAEFYTKTFGWGAENLGPDMGNYVTVNTVETKDGRPVVPGAINGGIYNVTPEMPPQHPSFVIAVDDLDAAMQSVKDNGGQVVGEPWQIPGVGMYVSITDTEGNRLSLLLPDPRQTS